MRLSKINPWSSPTYSPPRKVDEADAATTKPPDVDAGVSGVQVQSVTSTDDQPLDEPPSHVLDITI
jgi:hypothetical protein